VTVAEKKLHFSAHGYGAKGQHNYGFVLDFHSSVDPEVSTIHIYQLKCMVCKLLLFPLIAGEKKRTTWLSQY
jgi:hypothetical protein